MDRENRNFIVIFTAMFMTILVLYGCTGIRSTNSPSEILCEVSCDADGGCSARAVGTGEVATSREQVKLDTPTQTKVGLPDE